jgi:SAM-dependent methyltransferase
MADLDHDDPEQDDLDHDELVRRSFRSQVPQFGVGSAFAARPGVTDWLEPLSPDLVVLEVACGAAHLGGALAPRVHQVVGLDLTAELLDLGAARLADEGVRNVLLQVGDASSMPFVDRSYDLVVCRASLHHMRDPRGAVAEMVRVCRPGGRVAISELVAPDGCDRDRFDALHRLLDPSHRATFRAGELESLFPAGVDLRAAPPTTSRFPLTIAVTPEGDGRRVRRELADELDGAAPTGFAPTWDDDELVVSFVTANVVATVAPDAGDRGRVAPA